MKRAVCLVAGLSFLVGACAAGGDKRPPEEPKNAQSEAAPSAGAAPPEQPGYPSPPPTPMPTSPAQPAQTPTTSPTRQADGDLERAQRELAVAAGDCQNACRALSSMDRAAGRICSLSSGTDDDKQRCSEAKDRVYSARDKVKNSCGTCSETSVDRNAPVPSTR